MFIVHCSLFTVQLSFVIEKDPAISRNGARRDAGRNPPGLCPSWKHPFGNDELGRDILSRILGGTRVSMRGCYGGGHHSLLAFPGILFAIALVAFLGRRGLDRMIFALTPGASSMRPRGFNV